MMSVSRIASLIYQQRRSCDTLLKILVSFWALHAMQFRIRGAVGSRYGIEASDGPALRFSSRNLSAGPVSPAPHRRSPSRSLRSAEKKSPSRHTTTGRIGSQTWMVIRYSRYYGREPVPRFSMAVADFLAGWNVDKFWRLYGRKPGVPRFGAATPSFFGRVER